jgi:hypothetical protein
MRFVFQEDTEEKTFSWKSSVAPAFFVAFGPLSTGGSFDVLLAAPVGAAAPATTSLFFGVCCVYMTLVTDVVFFLLVSTANFSASLLCLDLALTDSCSLICASVHPYRTLIFLGGLFDDLKELLS